MLEPNSLCVSDLESIGKSLRPGKQSGIRLVGSEKGLRALVADLTQGATPLSRPGHNGDWFRRTNGIEVGRRNTSSNRSGGGPTIDIRFPDDRMWKVHIQ